MPELLRQLEVGRLEAVEGALEDKRLNPVVFAEAQLGGRPAGVCGKARHPGLGVDIPRGVPEAVLDDRGIHHGAEVRDAPGLRLGVLYTVNQLSEPSAPVT